MTVWTDFVKKWAAKNGKTYGCAMSDPKLKEEYKQIKGNKKVKGIELEEAMPNEPAPKNLTIRPRGNYLVASSTQRLPTEAPKPERNNVFDAQAFIDKPAPKRLTKKYKEEFNRNREIVVASLKEKRDSLFAKLEKDIFGNNIYSEEGKKAREKTLRNATPYSADGLILNINRERVKVPPSFKIWKELDDKIDEIPSWNI